MAASDPPKAAPTPKAEEKKGDKKKGKGKEEDLSEEDLALQAEMTLLAERAGDSGESFAGCVAHLPRSF